jgi:hypothetical protein
MSEARTFQEMNDVLAKHSDVLVVLNHDDYNVIVIEKRNPQNVSLTVERVGMIFTAPYIHPTSQYNFVNMLGCDEVVFNNTFFELTAKQLMDCCSLNQPIDDQTSLI